jgi:hypothetical protein
MSVNKIVHEGEQVSHVEILDESESLEWDIEVDDDYDIGFSISILSSSSSGISRRNLLEQQRVKILHGRIEYCDLKNKQVVFPVEIEFVLDNSYSWFSPKQCVLNISRTKSEYIAEKPFSPEKTPPRLSRTSSRSTPESTERKRESDQRLQVDLVWMKHVIAEALNRCPEHIPQLRDKLSEVNGILDSQPISNSAI